MTTAALALVSSGMDILGLNYAFMQWADSPDYPYFTGEYQEAESLTEDGLQESTFILNGWTRGAWLELEQAKEMIENYFNRISGKRVIVEGGSAVAVFYASSSVIPTGDAELKRIQINLTVKEWKVN